MAMVVANYSTTTSSSSSEVEMIQINSSNSQSGSRTLELISVSPQSHVIQIESTQLQRPSFELIEDRRLYFEKCVPLQKLALKGNWNAAKRMIDEENRLLKAAIDKRIGGTLLHVVAGTDHVHFVKELIELLDPCDLELRNYNDNTAFCYAAASGNLKIVDIMIEKNGQLPKIRGAEEATPLYMAALQGRNDMTRHLFPLTDTILKEDEWSMMFFLCIENGLYDLAVKMLKTKPMLASARNDKDETALHILAQKVADFSCQGRRYLQNLVMSSGVKPTPIVELVRRLWNMLLESYTETKMRILISHPTQVAFNATIVGNFHFVAELIRPYPDLMWETDVNNRSIFHIAVLHRHSSIFNLIHEVNSIKDFIVTFEDNEEKNNMLHCAAKLAPPHQLKLISGVALQMTHELLWFQEVKKIMMPSDIEKKNSNGKTPRELFADEHKELRTKAESWIESTANNCLLVSTLIATGVFMATFNIPGGRNNKTGTPTYLDKPTFLIFAISDATALISSAASILMFLSILISSYAEDEYFRSLPSKLLFGLIAQFISITSMMIAFSVSFFIAYYHGSKWEPNFISVLVFLPVPLFTLVLFPLWLDVLHSSYFCISLFRPRKKMLY